MKISTRKMKQWPLLEIQVIINLRFICSKFVIDRNQ